MSQIADDAERFMICSFEYTNKTRFSSKSILKQAVKKSLRIILAHQVVRLLLTSKPLFSKQHTNSKVLGFSQILLEIL